MLHIIWRFRVRHDRLNDFVARYNANGAWATLFARSPDYRGTQLLQDVADPPSFLTIDRWTSQQAFDNFKQEFAAEYLALDCDCESLTEEEVKVGIFTDQVSSGISD